MHIIGFNMAPVEIWFRETDENGICAKCYLCEIKVIYSIQLVTFVKHRGDLHNRWSTFPIWRVKVRNFNKLYEWNIVFEFENTLLTFHRHTAKSYSGTLLCFFRERKVFEILEQIRGQVRQNTLMLQSLVKERQRRVSCSVEEFSLPLKTEADFKHLEQLLDVNEKQKCLVGVVITLI